MLFILKLFFSCSPLLYFHSISPTSTTYSILLFTLPLTSS